ncbi:MAG: hypothetical protein QN120_09020 [Armatimonadota bacterium]|nr:hypothetical protein [Armatimonadota bacterium]
MDFGAFLRYWALTLAVFAFYLFALIVASLDVLESLRETARKRRAERKPVAGDPNPLATRSVAQTIFPGPGQQLDGKRAWVAKMAEDIVRAVNPQPPVRTIVLEDSKGHPVVHFSDGRRLATYRFDRARIEAAMAGDAEEIAEVADRLRRHLMADFLGREDVRPPRTTELMRESTAKPAAAKPQAPVAAAAPTSPEASARAEVPAPAAPQPAGDPESMSREERLAAARAKAEALRAARAAQKPPAT